MVRYLLETNILSDLLRNPASRVARKLAVVGETAVCTSIVVACELRYGAAKKGSPQLSERAEILLQSLEILSLEKKPTATMPGPVRISNWLAL
jgi:tRNA(fMet)-specific endonuclease VapC